MNTFIQFKEAEFLLSPRSENPDLFRETFTLENIDEDDFFKWLNKQIQVKSQIKKGVNPKDVVFSMKKWHFFYDFFERVCLKEATLALFPKDGYFETVNDNGLVAAFLPEPSSKGKFRVSYYDQHGPKNHNTFDDRISSYGDMISSGCIVQKEGAIEELMINNKKSWDRGLWVCYFCSSSYGSVIEGVISFIKDPEIIELFPDTIEHIKEHNLI